MTHGHSLAFSKAPKLREVTLEADDRRGDHLLRTLSLALPWAQIKKLVTSGVFHTASDARDIILKCPLLEHCSLGRIFVPPRGEVIPYVPICTFSHLRSLSVVFRTDFLGNEASFFQPLVMPTLQQLDIRATALPVSSETPAYISFIYFMPFPSTLFPRLYLTLAGKCYRSDSSIPDFFWSEYVSRDPDVRARTG